MTAEIERRLALEAAAARLAGLHERILHAARSRRVGFLEADRETTALGLVVPDDCDLPRDAHVQG